MTFSIYSILLFANLCKPKRDENANAEYGRWQWNQTIKCIGWKDDDEELTIVEITWVLLVLMTTYFFIRDILECASLRLKFFMRVSTYRRLLTDALLIFCLYRGFPNHDLELERWQYHMASIAGFLLWLQTMIELGRYPGCGKYIMMFK